MSDPVVTQVPDAEMSTAPRTRSLLHRMRDRLRGFAVWDKQGKLAGEVQDLTLDPDNPQKQFNLVVSQPDSHQGSRLFLLNNRQLEKIDIPGRSLFTKLSSAEICRIPDYTASTHAGSASAGQSQSAAAPEVSPPTVAPDVAAEVSPSDEQHLPRQDAADQFSAVLASEQVIQLLEERLQVDRSKRKVGEIVVRKVVETRLVQVPIRREKLIVEQIGSDRPLVEIDIGSGEITGLALAQKATNAAGEPTASGEFETPQAAIRLFDTIAHTLRHRCKQINLELWLEDRGTLKTYHQLPSPQIAVQMLTAIAQTFAHRCKQVNVELVLEDHEIQRTYQKWIEHYRQQSAR